MDGAMDQLGGTGIGYGGIPYTLGVVNRGRVAPIINLIV